MPTDFDTVFTHSSCGFLSLSCDKKRLINLMYAPHAAFPCDPEIDLNKVEPNPKLPLLDRRS